MQTDRWDDVWLMHGDCLERMKEIPDGSVDMVLCDLPYGTTQCAWDTVIPFDRLWEQYRRIVKENGAIILFSAQPFTTDLINSNRKEYRYEIIWEKTHPTGFLNARKMPLRAHENIEVFYRRLPTYNPQKRSVQRNDIGRCRVNGTKAPHYGEYICGEYKYVETGERMPIDVVRFSNWNGALFGDTVNAVQHPTSKPVDILRYLILTYTNAGETVLDNTMGSGSTGMAALQTGRRFIGIELDDGFYQLALEHLSSGIQVGMIE